MSTKGNISSTEKRSGGSRFKQWSVAAALVAAGLACAQETVEQAPVARPVKMLTLGAGDGYLVGEWVLGKLRKV